MKTKILTTCIANAELINNSPSESGAVSFRVTPLGDFENVVQNRATGESLRIVQRVTLADMEEMMRDFSGLLNKAAHAFRGLPVYEGHIDFGDNEQTPAVGRVKKLYLKNDEQGQPELWADAVLNQNGIGLISGEAAPYSATSPFWWTADTLARNNAGLPLHKPVSLESVALVNKPNLPGNFIGLNRFDEVATDPTNQPNPNTKMNIREQLGLTAEATDDEVLAAIAALQDRASTAESGSAALNAKNTELGLLKNELAELKKSQTQDKATAAVNSAIEAGRIPESAKASWTAMLTSDFASANAALEAIPAVQGPAAVNTQNKIGALNKKAPDHQAANAATFQSELRAYAAANNLDLGKQDQHDQAYAGLQASKATV